MGLRNLLIVALIPLVALSCQRRVSQSSRPNESVYEAYRAYALDTTGKGLGYLQRLSRDNPEDAHLLYMLSRGYLQAGDTLEAYRTLVKATALDSNQLDMWSLRYSISAIPGVYSDSSLKEAIQCARLDTASDDAQIRLLLEYHRSSRYEECLDYAYKNYNTIQPNSFVDLVISSIYAQQHEVDSAKYYLRKYLGSSARHSGFMGYALHTSLLTEDTTLANRVFAEYCKETCPRADEVVQYLHFLEIGKSANRQLNTIGNIITKCSYTGDQVAAFIPYIHIPEEGDPSRERLLEIVDTMAVRYSGNMSIFRYVSRVYSALADPERIYKLSKAASEKSPEDESQRFSYLHFMTYHLQDDSGRWVPVSKLSNREYRRLATASWGEYREETYRYMRDFPWITVMPDLYIARTSWLDSGQNTRIGYDSLVRITRYFEDMLSVSSKKDMCVIHTPAGEVRATIPRREVLEGTLSYLHGRLGDEAHSLGIEWESHYSKSLAYDEDNHNVLNNYSYFLVLRDPKSSLRKARKMAKRAVELAPSNVYYRDTYGYILYLAGDYEESKSQFATCFSLSSKHSAEVYMHYSLLLRAMGNTAAADVYLLKAEQASK